jgi:gliding motility-associated-like protein
VVSGGAFGFEWEEDPTLSGNRFLNPVVSPFVTTDYVLVGYTADPADNLVVNGDFEQGNVGFTTEYDFEPGGQFGAITPDGSYSITTNSNAVHSLFNPCRDNSGSGNMMASNGSTQPNLKVWCQTVNVVPNTDYVLRAFIASIWDRGRAELQFSINNDLVGPIFRPTLTPPCTYDFFDERWSSEAGETTAEICVVNQTTELVGFNFSLDDIFFAPICEQYDTVRVEMVDTEFTVGDTYDLPCGLDAAGFQIEAIGATTPGYTYRWTTTNGNIVSGANQPIAFVDAAGLYTVTLSFTDGINSCSDVRTIDVTANDLPPDLLLESDGDLNCNRDVTAITAENSTLSSVGSYSWTTTDGNIISDPTGEFILVDAPGTYELTVFTGACADTETFTVLEDFATPTALVNPAGDLSCTTTLINLNAANSIIGPDDFFYWTTLDGLFSGSTNTLRPTVVAPGTYVLVVENAATGCFDEAIVQIGGSSDPTVATIADPPRINCQGDPVVLESNGSTLSTDVVYAWTTTNGLIDGPTDGLTLRVIAAGDYQLLITEANGCNAEATVTVEQEGFNPAILFQPTQAITCDRARVIISAEVPTTATVTYAWTTTDGQILSGENTLNPEVTAGGVYRLLVTEPSQGCSVSASVTVTEDRTPPLAITAATATINCLNPSIPLTTTSSTTGPDITFTWRNEAGDLVQDAVDTPGNYELTVRNGENACSTSAILSVAIDTLAPTVNLTSPATLLSCVQDSLVLAETTPVAGVVYRWTGPEGNATGPLVTVGTPGIYLLTATNATNACTAFDTLSLRQNQDLPIIALDAVDALNCERTQIVLPASVANPAGFELSWSTTGNIVSGANTLTPTVDAPGNYQLTLLNPTTGCTDSVAITVLANTTLPVATIFPADTLTCLTQVVGLDGAGSTSGDSIVYAWSAVTGSLSGPTDGNTANAETAGRYLLTVRNRENGCTVQDTVTVAIDTLRPSVSVTSLATLLTCAQDSLVLAEAMPVAGVDYRWTGPEGDATGPLVTVGTPGTYLLTATNATNACTTFDTLSLRQNQDLPIIAIDAVDALTCDRTQLVLPASVANPAGFELSWSTTGNIVSGANTLTPTVDESGDYQLTLRNPTTGCTDSLAVTVLANTNLPVAVTLPADTLSCLTEVVGLDGAGSTSGDSIVYAWSAVSGSLSGATNELVANAVAAGSYLLTVRNQNTGCSAEATVVVVENGERPIINLPESVTLSCLLPAITLNAGAATEPGLRYNWENTTTATSISDQVATAVTAAGNYQLTVENESNGCITAASVMVGIDTISPVATIASVGELNCTVTELLLESSGSAMAGATYAWTTNDGSFAQNNGLPQSRVAAAGAYALRIRNPNGCTDSTTVAVSIDTLRPVISLPNVAVLSCRDAERTILAVVSEDQGASIRYEWRRSDGTIDGNATGPSLTVDRAGVYALRITNETNTCEGLANVTVGIDTLRPVLAELPTATINCNRRETRPNPTIISGRAVVDYDWVTLSGPSLTTGIATPLVNAGGTFELTVTDPINGCASSRGWTVIQDTVAPVVDLPEVIDLGCDLLPVTVTAQTDLSAGYAFSWSTVGGAIISGQNNSIVELEGPGAYFLSVNNPLNGCETARELSVTQTLLDGFSFDLSVPDCSRETGSLTFGEVAGGIGPFVYSIDGGRTYAADVVYRGLMPDNYDLRVQDVRGCEAALPASVPVVRRLEIGLTDNFALRQGDSVRLAVVLNFDPSEIDTVIWSTAPGLSCYDCLGPVARPLASTNYEVEVRSLDGCRARAQVQILVDERGVIYVPNAFSPNGDGVNDLLSPLAATQRVKRVLSFEVFDRWGNEVYRAVDLPVDGSGGGWDGQLRGKPLNVGVCVWRAEVEMTDRRIVRVNGEVVIMR